MRLFDRDHDYADCTIRHNPDCDSLDTNPDGIEKPCNCHKDMQNKATIEKLRDMIAGKSCVMSDDELDIIDALDRSFCVRSMPNPKQVGTKDPWLCWIEQRDVKRLKLDAAVEGGDK